MDKWKKGDIAICVKVGDIRTNTPGLNPPLQLYAEYIVNDIHTCFCGDVSLDVGLGSHVPTICYCGRHLNKLNTHWCNSIRFVKKESKELIELEIAAAVEVENYELAQILKERLETV